MKLEDRNHVFYEAMGEIDCEILQDVEKIQEKPLTPKALTKGRNKQKAMWAAIACICLLGASSNGLVRHFTGGRITIKEDGRGLHGRFSSLEGKVYAEEDEILYYNFEKNIFNQNKEDITAFCSETDYYFLPQIDEGGSGYVMAVGGESGNRGHIIAYYERGEVMLLRGKFDRTEFPELFQIDANPFKETWARHLMEWLGKDGVLSSQFWGSELGEVITTEIGSGTKVTEQGYWVEGYEVAPLTMREAVAVGMLEMQSVEGYNGGGAGFDCPDWDNPYDFSLVFSICLAEDNTPIDLEAAHEILGSLCDSYILEVYQNDIEVVKEGNGTTHYHTPRTIYEVEVTPEGRTVTMEGEFSWMEH